MKKLAALFAITILLQGCVSTPNCVAVANPNEAILNGKVVAKTEAKDIQLAEPTGKVVNDTNEAGAFIAMGALGLGGAVGAAGAAYLASPENLHVTPSVGGDCGGSTREIEHGWRYAVAAEDGHTYTIASAFGGFDTNECVRLYVSKNGDRLQGRIAQGGSCERMP